MPSRRRAAPWALAAALAGVALTLGVWLLTSSDEVSSAGAVPDPLPGAVVLGSDLGEPGSTLDCREHRVTPASPECTIVQTALPGATLVVPQDGVIRRWSVRSAHGELSLAGLRPREGGASQFARSATEFAENDGVFTFPANFLVERGDLLGLVAIGGSGVGARPVDGATTERWIPHVGLPRPPEFPAGKGFDNELLLRVELTPGGKQTLPRRVQGPAAARLPAGRVLARRGAHPAKGGFFEIEFVEIGKRIVLDELLDGRRVGRIDVPGFPPGGEIVTFHATVNSDEGDVEIYLEYVAAGSARLLSHFYACDARGIDFID
jgi:hypothetical protein